MPAAHRPRIVLVAAATIDGKITDTSRNAFNLGSDEDRVHLLREISAADAVLISAGTLRAYRQSWILPDDLVKRRISAGRPPQPIHVVCSTEGPLMPNLPFFVQPIERWLITAALASADDARFSRTIVVPPSEGGVDIRAALRSLAEAGIEQAVVLAGGRFNAALLAAECLDEVVLTICPFIVGGADAPTLIDGVATELSNAQRFATVEVKQGNSEIFVRYRHITTDSPRGSRTDESPVV